MQNIKTIPQLAVQNLPADLESKADADEVVLLTGNQTVEGNKNLTETPVIQLWNADINPTANQTIVFSINSVGTFELYKNKTGINGNNPPAQDGTNWEFISTGQGSRAYVQEFAPSESPVSSVTLTEGICYNADFMTVAVDHTILDPSAYILGINGTTITFVEPVEAGLTITVRWFTEMNLSNVYRQPLLSCFWSDHLIYELSYLCADTFSWQDGNVYSAVYDHLVADIDGKSTTTEGLITYYLADDGHKIAVPTSHDAVADLYDETGVAWYYILDVENHRFKLPRTKYAFSGWRGDVGDYIPESLPNITGSLYNCNTTFQDIGLDDGVASGAIQIETDSNRRFANQNNTEFDNNNLGWSFNASRSSSAYQDNAPVQQRGTQMYLYFYVGNYTPQAVEQTAGYAQTLTELKADKDLANSPYTTNRILEIPQDIQLELNDGTLTLKAGSKLYKPNGFETDGTTPKFDVVTLNNDVSSINYGEGRSGCIPVYTSRGTIEWSGITSYFSGTTQPQEDWWIWYDTNTNNIKFYDGSTIYPDCYLPLGLITENAGSGVGSGIKSIDQVFNGFGYIGSTMFALPGVKVQGAFGVNEDGTYKLKTFVTDHVLTYSFDSNVSGRHSLGFDVVENGTITYFGAYTNEIKVGEKQPSGIDFMWWNPIKGETHYVDFSGIAEDTSYTSPRLGQVNVSGGKIDSIVRNLIDSIVTSNALNFSKTGRSYLSGLGMPSNRYIDLTLGASGSTYTAPANGYMYLGMTATVADQYANITDGQGLTNIQNARAVGNYLDCFVAFKKGDVGIISYDAGTLRAFRFYYAEGEN